MVQIITFRADDMFFGFKRVVFLRKKMTEGTEKCCGGCETESDVWCE